MVVENTSATVTHLENNPHTPLYKKWWVWVIIALVVSLLGFGVVKTISADNPAKTVEQSMKKDSKQTVKKLSEEKAKSAEKEKKVGEDKKQKDEEKPAEKDSEQARNSETVTPWDQHTALERAESIIKFQAFSRKGLFAALVYDKFSETEANDALDKLNVDWNEQAKKMAESYLNYKKYNKADLIDQLIYEGFTPEQAESGATAVGLE